MAFRLPPCTAPAARSWRSWTSPIPTTPATGGGTAQPAWHNRERLGLLRVRDDAIVLHAMRWPDEIRGPESLKPKDVDLDEEEIERAVQLTGAMALDDISGFRDEYRAALEELIEAKSEGTELPEPAEGEEKESGKVVDLMAALNASVKAARESRGEHGQDQDAIVHSMQPRKKTTAKKAAPARKSIEKKTAAGKKAHGEEDRGREEAQRVLSGRPGGMVMVGLPRIAPMLATPGSLPSADVEDRWAFEVKEDGQRAMVYLPGDGTMVLRSRSGADISAVYPELAGLGTVLGRPAVLDGEIVTRDDEGRSDFERLQSRMGAGLGGEGRPDGAAGDGASGSVRCLALSTTLGSDCSRLRKALTVRRDGCSRRGAAARSEDGHTATARPLSAAHPRSQRFVLSLYEQQSPSKLHCPMKYPVLLPAVVNIRCAPTVTALPKLLSKHCSLSRTEPDAVYLDGDSLTGLPYTERRTLLEELGLDGKHWSTPAAVVGHGEQALEMPRTARLEGLVAKQLTSVYEPGVRSRSWIKIRHIRTADVIVGGWVPGRGRLTGLPGALLVGEAHAGGLRYVGSVGTGWSDTERTTLAELLHVAAINECPFDKMPRVAGARWVLPRLVGEVRYTSRTRAGLLRHPSWHRLRPDLAPDGIM